MAEPCEPTIDQVQRVGRLFRVRLVRACPMLVPAGSPDRCLGRVVALAEGGERYVVERLAAESAPRKMAIAALLDALQRSGLGCLNPYLSTADGHHVVPMGADYWQVSPYLEGSPLPRPDWAWEGWRGAALARFLIELAAAAPRVAWPEAPAADPHAFCGDLSERLRIHRPALARELAPILEPLLAEWLPRQSCVRTSPCHGDLHPLNVIWSPEGRAPLAVIDWEFCGPRPVAYDLALLLGCIGIEEPSALTGPFAGTLLGSLREAGHPAAVEPALWALVLAIRFAWLSDWLRRGDEEMVSLEHAYLQLLVARRAELEAAWGQN